MWRLQIQNDIDTEVNACFYFRLYKHNMVSKGAEHKTVFQIQFPFGQVPLNFPSSLTIPPWNIKSSHTHFSSCVLACSSLTSACMLSTWSSSFLMVYISCCFSSNSDAAAELFLSRPWHLTEQGKNSWSLLFTFSWWIWHTRHITKRIFVWFTLKAYFDEEQGKTKMNLYTTIRKQSYWNQHSLSHYYESQRTGIWQKTKELKWRSCNHFL